MQYVCQYGALGAHQPARLCTLGCRTHAWHACIYPLRSQRSARRATVYGGCYTQDDVRLVVATASSLGIDVIPEIELPGHCGEARQARPQPLSSPTPPSTDHGSQPAFAVPWWMDGCLPMLLRGGWWCVQAPRWPRTPGCHAAGRSERCPPHGASRTRCTARYVAGAHAPMRSCTLGLVVRSHSHGGVMYKEHPRRPGFALQACLRMCVWL